MAYNAFKYSLKVWLTGAALALIITWLTDFFIPFLVPQDTNYFFNEVIERAIAVLIITLTYGILLFICLLFIQSLRWNTLSTKWALTGISFFISWVPVMVLVIFSEDMEPLSFGYKMEVLVYILLNCFCIWFYKLSTNDGNIVLHEIIKH